MTRQPLIGPISPLLKVAFFGLLLAAAAFPSDATETSYGYFRTVEGYSSLTQSGSNSRNEIVANYPILAGDRVLVSRDGRLEAVLPDGSYLRLASDTEVVFDRLAFSADTEDDQTLLRLIAGELQVVISNEGAEDQTTRIDTINATVYLPRNGSYRIRTDGDSWSEVVVREGYAEIVTERGSSIVRAEEQSLVEGQRNPQLTLAAAPPLDSLERWGDELFRLARSDQPQYVEPALSYSAAPLTKHGYWLNVGGTHAWRPYVKASWAPYTYGRWTYTPSGLNWVSYEPWGWVTHHYGVWDYRPAFGWIWYPGYSYYPAAVYWYWGPTYVGWIPWGYYSYHYRPYSWHFSIGFRFGVYGWAGGSWHHFSHWTFSPTTHFGHHDSHLHHASGAALATRQTTAKEVPRGVITTDTRGLNSDTWNDPEAAIETLTDRGARQAVRRGRPKDLPDVTAFVARRGELPENVLRAVTPLVRERPLAARPTAQRLDQIREDVTPTVSRSVRDRPEAPSSSRPAARVDADRGVSDWREGQRARADTTRPTLRLEESTKRPLDREKPRVVSPDRPSTRSPVRTETQDWRDRSKSTNVRGREVERREVTPVNRPRIESGSRMSGRDDSTNRESSWRGSREARPPTKPATPSRESTRSGTTPPVKRVVDEVRSYRSRSRSETRTSPTAPSPRASTRSRTEVRPSRTAPSPRSSTVRRPSQRSSSSSVQKPGRTPTRPSGSARSSDRGSRQSVGSKSRGSSRSSGRVDKGSGSRSSSSRRPAAKKSKPSG